MEKLERRLGLTGVVAISISAMLGSGIFVLPGLAAGLTGPSVFLAYIVAGICVLPAALSKSELATAMPTSGGTYVYLDRAFGPLVRVNAVAPGPINTRWLAPHQAHIQQYLKQTPLQKAAEPEDIADTIWYLATGTSMTTGQILVVDGGRTM